MKMVTMKQEVTFLQIEGKKNNSKGYITVWLHIYINIKQQGVDYNEEIRS